MTANLLNVLDVGRALGNDPRRATPDQVAAWLMEQYFKKPGGGFNYDPASKVLFDLFRGALTLEEATRYCREHGNPRGRKQNTEAIKAVGPFAIGNQSTCYRIGNTAVEIGRIQNETVFIGIKAPLVRVRHDEAFIVMPGFRLSHRPSEIEIDVACSIALAQFGRDDFAGADFEYLYAGPGVSGEREFRSIRGRERNIYDRDEVDQFLDVYVNGLALAVERGLILKKPTLRGYRVVDPSQPYMF